MNQPPAEAVYAAIERLPVLLAQRRRVLGAVTMLCIAAPVLALNNVPHLRKSGSKSADRKLGELERHLSLVLSALKALPAEAVNALAETTGRHPLQLHDNLSETAAAIKASRAIVSAANEPVGRPPKLDAAGIAEFALTVFEGLTGKRATITVNAYARGNVAGGLFLEFVRDLFEAFAIDASPENFARAAIEKEKRSPKPAA